MSATVSKRIALDLHGLYEDAPCGYHSVGPDGTILRMNRTELTWLGFMHAELVGARRFAEIVSAGSCDEYKRAFESFRAGQDSAEIETELTRKNGSLFDATLRIEVVRDSHGRFLHTRAVVIDITERKRAQTEAQIRAEQLQAISLRFVQMQEAERRNLSAELHDRIGQDLASLNLNLHIVKNQLSAGSRTRVGQRLDDSISLIERTVECVRDVAGALRPLALDDYGLAVTLKSYGEQFAARTGIRVIVECKDSIPPLRKDAEIALFRISQEALTNVLKHARASMVCLTLGADSKNASLTIADDGCGYAAEPGIDRVTKGLGLLIMQERLRAAGGSLRIVSRPGAGTRVVAEVTRAQ